jgi:starch synthase
MRILYLASEVVPYSKTGGLADVAGALPRAIASLGHEVRVVTPLYRGITPTQLTTDGAPLTLTFPFGTHQVTYRSTPLERGHSVTFVDVPALFDRPAIYGHDDDARRFAFFTMAALSWAQRSGFNPDVVWGNDWQTGLMPIALQTGFAHTPLGRSKSLFTIHNLAYQGNFARTELEALGIPWSYFGLDGVEFYGHLGFLKAGLVRADLVSTVSPSYAKEIQTAAGGMSLDGVLRSRPHGVVGILNGIDTAEWNSATDVLLPARYTAADLSGRATCRGALLDAFRLTPPTNAPVFGVVGRMVDQKGVDLLQAVLPRFLEQGARAVVLGNGDPVLENGWRAMQLRFPDRLGVKIGFDNSLAHLIEAGSDFFLMPSRFEPCGLNQMYSLVYGAVPVVHAVGGLKDTVVDFAEPEGTGVVFKPATAEGLFSAMLRAVELFRDAPAYAAVQRRGMKADFSWASAARKWLALLES